jgi:DNA-binding transcriptional regulator GbsR (MarR family)
MITELVTEEQLLDLCLFKELNSRDGDDSAFNLIVAYVYSKNKELTDDEIREGVSELMVDYTLKTLAEKDLVRPVFGDDGEITYEIVEDSKDEPV